MPIRRRRRHGRRLPRNRRRRHPPPPHRQTAISAGPCTSRLAVRHKAMAQHRRPNTILRSVAVSQARGNMPSRKSPCTRRPANVSLRRRILNCRTTGLHGMAVATLRRDRVFRRPDRLPTTVRFSAPTPILSRARTAAGLISTTISARGWTAISSPSLRHLTRRSWKTRRRPDRRCAKPPTGCCAPAPAPALNSNGWKRACRCHHATTSGATRWRGDIARPAGIAAVSMKRAPGGALFVEVGCRAHYPSFLLSLTPTYWVMPCRFSSRSALLFGDLAMSLRCCAASAGLFIGS